jgi:hypothetical protein
MFCTPQRCSTKQLLGVTVITHVEYRSATILYGGAAVGAARPKVSPMYFTTRVMLPHDASGSGCARQSLEFRTSTRFAEPFADMSSSTGTESGKQ